MKYKIWIVIGTIIIAFAAVWLFMGIHYKNAEKRLRNAIPAQEKVREAVFDNTWKIISQQAQIPDNFRDNFKDAYADIMAGNESRMGGTLMKFVQESNPNFDIGPVYEKLMASITAERTNFTREQTELADMKREHDNLIDTEPSSWWNSEKEKIEVVMITSTKTKIAVETGIDDDVNLFNMGEK